MQNKNIGETIREGFEAMFKRLEKSGMAKCVTCDDEYPKHFIKDGLCRDCNEPEKVFTKKKTVTDIADELINDRNDSNYIDND